MDNTENEIIETTPQLSRKRVQQRSNWTVNIKKVKRYSAKGPPLLNLPFQHYSKAYRCPSLTNKDIAKFHRAFYKTSTKLDQDNFIIQHSKVANIKRRRPVTGLGKKKNLNIIYYARCRNHLIPVCRSAFLQILGIKKGRVLGVVRRNWISGGTAATETRGGNRKENKYCAIKTSIKNFIKKLESLEIHYCRSKIKARQYLSSELNVNKLYKLYVAQAREQNSRTKLSYFRRIFNTSFNIGFGSPRTDMCSTCIELREKLKYEKNTAAKNEIMIQLRIHKLRSRAFYKLLQKDKEDLLILSFDCQKNQPKPKVPDQSAYYSRQLYVHNLTIVAGHSKSKLTPKNTFIYAWTEDLLPKASNEIVSAVFHCLVNIINKPEHQKVQNIRLVADGCSGQNKNVALLGMAAKWLKDHAHPTIKSIEILFPIVGHSFLPPDRIFARIEKEIKRHEVISNPEEYYDIFKNHGTLFLLGVEVQVYKWKEAASDVLKLPGQMHFPFKRSKRFFVKIKKNDAVVRAEESYNMSLGKYKNICKTKNNISNLNPGLEQLYVNVKENKLNDVKKLLAKHYGENWKEMPELVYYKNVFERPNDLIMHQESNIELCENDEEFPEVFV